MTTSTSSDKNQDSIKEKYTNTNIYTEDSVKGGMEWNDHRL